MRDIAEQTLGWLVLAGIVLAVVLAKRRYENKFAAAVAAADANARAEVRNELAVGQHVQVAVDASHNSEAAGHQCGDPWACAVCAPVLYRALVAGDRRSGRELESPSRATRIHDNYHGAHYYVHDRGDVDQRAGAVDRAVVSDDGGSGESRGVVAGDGAAGVDLAGVPCASLRPTVRGLVGRGPGR